MKTAARLSKDQVIPPQGFGKQILVTKNISVFTGIVWERTCISCYTQSLNPPPLVGSTGVSAGFTSHEYLGRRCHTCFSSLFHFRIVRLQLRAIRCWPQRFQENHPMSITGGRISPGNVWFFILMSLPLSVVGQSDNSFFLLTVSVS